MLTLETFSVRIIYNTFDQGFSSDKGVLLSKRSNFHDILVLQSAEHARVLCLDGVIRKFSMSLLIRHYLNTGRSVVCFRFLIAPHIHPNFFTTFIVH